MTDLSQSDPRHPLPGYATNQRGVCGNCHKLKVVHFSMREVVTCISSSRICRSVQKQKMETGGAAPKGGVLEATAQNWKAKPGGMETSDTNHQQAHALSAGAKRLRCRGCAMALPAA